MASPCWNARTRALVPYVPGEQPRDRAYIKLNTNENPYPPSPAALAALHAAADETLRLYPDPTGLALREVIAALHGVTAAEVFVGNGSDEILAFAFAAFFSAECPLLAPDITYSFYPVYAQLYAIPYTTVPLTDDFSVPVDALCVPGRGVALANPNAPTGRALPAAAIARIAAADRTRAVICDEAYVAFGGESMAAHLGEHPNLLVVRTLSKSHALAGLRVGYALGNAELIDGLVRIKDSFNSYPLDRLALAGAAAALQDTAYYAATTAQVVATRERVVAHLQQAGTTVIPSAANFIFLSHPSRPAAELFAGLRARGVLVRHFRTPRISNWLRVSIGTDAEMDAFLTAFTELL